ncbi:MULTISPECIES: hypothetical protein [unclassified Pseudonocardia]|uniref:hypothetical protein n=1 Tax=unclassified Pseudonocardia TaxID=2619320 RepID=UPI0001FFE390|nr:hypothetical protein [Pseudonocardia sp. Ae707_Ps1]
MLTVTADGLTFEPNPAEKRLRADALSVPASDVRSVSVEPRSIRRPMSWGVHRVLRIEADRREGPLRIGVNHGSRVAPLVSVVLAGAEDERTVRRVERKVRQQFPTVLLWGQTLTLSLFLLAQLGPALLWGDAPLDAGRVSLSVMIALLMSVCLAVLVYRGVRGRPHDPQEGRSRPSQ